MSSLLLLLGGELELLSVESLQPNPNQWRDGKSHQLRVSSLTFSLALVKEEPGRTRLAFICSMAVSEMGSPSSFSAMARLSQS